MVFWLIIVSPLVVLLAIAVFVDRKSKRVRGRVGRVRTGNEVGNRLDVLAADNLSMFDAGPGVAKHITDHPPTN